MNAPQNQKTTSEILTDFTSYVFNHPSALTTYRELMTAISAEASPRVIIFTGPTGVGKSTLVKAACNRLLQHYQAQMVAEPDFVPVVTISAVPPNGNAFSWKDFYIRLLTDQHEPLINRKLLLPRQGSLLPDHGLGERALEHSVADALRRAVEEYCRRRRTRYLIIDEAHHMLLVNTQQRLDCQFECLKSLTIQTGVTILLTGTYRLLDILEQSGQLTRRSQVVNFPRYDMRRSSDLLSFRKVLGFLEAELSKYIPTRLDENAEYFYRKSAGCVGILKDWLTLCLEHALDEGVTAIDAVFAERFALKNRGLLTIAEEACLGEAKLADVGDDRLTDLLKNGVLLARDEPSLPTRRRRPGQRNPKRDPVGKDERGQGSGFRTAA
ncbi:ATP-binding protein [uncultured Propionivibrio sp.]|uniref:ATP-binding protein n=1 Tax=uncultured Propionivibrio sp. TaxID=426737 RepID=UPI0029C0D3C7|nr:ATP-binding protein [uncultured Propionivibrio sp.]